MSNSQFSKFEQDDLLRGDDDSGKDVLVDCGGAYNDDASDELLDKARGKRPISRAHHHQGKTAATRTASSSSSSQPPTLAPATAGANNQSSPNGAAQQQQQQANGNNNPSLNALREAIETPLLNSEYVEARGREYIDKRSQYYWKSNPNAAAAGNPNGQQENGGPLNAGTQIKIDDFHGLCVLIDALTFPHTFNKSEYRKIVAYGLEMRNKIQCFLEEQQMRSTFESGARAMHDEIVAASNKQQQQQQQQAGGGAAPPVSPPRASNPPQSSPRVK